jgi:hypothetical protein
MSKKLTNPQPIANRSNSARLDKDKEIVKVTAPFD